MSTKILMWLDSLGLTASAIAFIQNIGTLKSNIVFIASMVFVTLRVQSLMYDLKRKKIKIESERLELEEQEYDLNQKINSKSDDDNEE